MINEKKYMTVNLQLFAEDEDDFEVEDGGYVGDEDEEVRESNEIDVQQAKEDISNIKAALEDEEETDEDTYQVDDTEEGNNDSFYEENNEQSIRNAEAAFEKECKIQWYKDQGYSKNEAERLALIEVKDKYGDSMYDESEYDASFNREIKKLVSAGHEDAESLKADIFTKMQVYNLSAFDAYLKVNKPADINMSYRLDLSEAEQKYYKRLSSGEREMFSKLNAAQPKAKWTYEKLYKKLHTM